MEEVVLIAGVDEVGGGDCIAGPIVAAAVVFDLNKKIPHTITRMRDSKGILRKEGFEGIERRFQVIAGSCECWRVGSASAQEITLLRTSRCKSIAMGKAVSHLDPQPRYVKTDGDIPIPPGNIGYYVPQKARPKADELFWLVSCASIVARYIRDTLMIDLHNLHPSLQPYGFDQNYGRSTQAHLDAITKHGASRLHRKRYKEVRMASVRRMEIMEAELSCPGRIP
jgi:ribonuclease HII